MPKKVDINSGHTKKWNMYVNEIEKLEYLKALIARGHSNAQSAAVRAFMFLYAHDPEVADKIDAILDDYMVYKQNGEPSHL